MPSKIVYTNSSPASGVQNRDIEYAEEVWNFFKGLQEKQWTTAVCQNSVFSAKLKLSTSK